jgi:hypothetical protein
MSEIVELCKHYTTTGYPTFYPKCEFGFRAGLRCHSAVTGRACRKYEPAVGGEDETTIPPSHKV